MDKNLTLADIDAAIKAFDTPVTDPPWLAIVGIMEVGPKLYSQMLKESIVSGHENIYHFGIRLLENKNIPENMVVCSDGYGKFLGIISLTDPANGRQTPAG